MTITVTARIYVPPAPPGVSLAKNIHEAMLHRPATFDQYLWFKHQVGPRRPWDYKRISGKYEAFGNFNFGATGAAMGIPDEVLLRAAGYFQPEKAQEPYFDTWWGSAPYGDDPADAVYIQQGIAYYHATCKCP